MSVKKSYGQLREELEEIILKLEACEDIDKSVELYEKGQKTATELEKYLTQLKAKVETIKNK